MAVVLGILVVLAFALVVIYLDHRHQTKHKTVH